MKSTLFAGPDSESLYQKNLKKLGEQWYYTHAPITYTWNSHKFRMEHEIRNTNWNNYIYFSGCSYTFGLGVELNKTFPYLTSAILRCDYVNTATIGASVELVLNNTLDFLSKAVEPPKAVVINWPEISRTLWWKDDGNFELYMPKEYSGTWKNSYKEFLLHDTHIYKRFEYIRKNIKVICNSLKIPLLEISTALCFDPSEHPVFENVHTIPSFHDKSLVNTSEGIASMHLSWGRDYGFHDGGHPGWKHHEYAANLITQWIQQ